MLKDEITITVKAGRGGDGCVSFRREAFAPRGGPDGGDGGHGGSVIFRATRNETSLYQFTRRRVIKAKPGEKGRGELRFGKTAPDEVLMVPLGTIIWDLESKRRLADLRNEGEEFVAARGGKGGRGNKKFATATHQVPHEFEYGEEGQERSLRLELRLIADVGIAGLPNAGKSTLLSRCSAARPKVAAYPFTTLEPKLGIVEREHARFAMADIPGLIEGAAEGKGLGHRFLRHIQRTRVIVHLIDASSGDVEQLTRDYATIRNELARHSAAIAAKPEIVVANKIDVTEAREAVAPFAAAIGKPVCAISAVTGEGLDDLLKLIWKTLSELPELPETEDTDPNPPPPAGKGGAEADADSGDEPEDEDFGWDDEEDDG